MISATTERLIVLGGGPAGLAAAWYGTRAGLEVTLIEAGKSPGGNARTLEFDSFRFDTGAHRLHARDREITEELLDLLGDDLRLIDVPSAIREGGSFTTFPLDPMNLLSRLGPIGVARSAVDLIRARLKGPPEEEDFESNAVYRYGRSIAERFLLGYTEKLWGVPAGSLSTEVSGRRLRGIDLRTFLGLAGQKRSERTRHLDGAFLYPRHGIGQITGALADELPVGAIRLEEPVDRITHRNNLLTSVSTPGQEYHPDGRTVIVSTLPIDRFVRMLSPQPPSEVVEAVASLRFRTLRVALIGLARDRLTEYASLYFPDRDLPFTRLYESKNRSSAMAPPGRTGVALELPTGDDDPWFTAERQTFLDAASDLLAREFDVSEDEILLRTEIRLPNAYPVLTTRSTAAMRGVSSWMNRFENVVLTGRNQRFRYVHIHDLLREARDLFDPTRLRD